MTDGSRKAVIYAFFANLGIAISKFAGFLITGSAGLLAEACHSVADTGNQALLLLGGKRARKAADRDHPFGYGRERYFWSFVVALVLFSMGGLFALYEGISKVRHPHEVENLPVAIVILLIAIVLETVSLRTAYKEAKHVKSVDVTWCRWLHKSKSPELPVVLLEDIGAEIGLFFALGGVLLAHFTDEPRWDAVGSIAIGVLLVVIAIVLAIEMKGLLIGEAASEQDLDLIVATLQGSRRCAPPDQPQDPAPRPRRAARRRQAGVRARPVRRGARRGDQQRRVRAPRRRADRPDHLPRTRRLPRPAPA